MLELTANLDDAASQLALDEALLLEFDGCPPSNELFRLWELPELAVIAGRSTRISDEVKLAACREDRVPIYRRASGGATVLAGPGCLMYSLHLHRNLSPRLVSPDAIHRHVLEPLAASLLTHVDGVAHRGISDLAIGNRKFSGNSLRIRRDAVLYHGTILYDFPMHTIGRYLRTPPRQPEYRQRRDHDDFVTALPVSRHQIIDAMQAAWRVEGKTDRWPREQAQALATKRYGRDEWTYQR